MAVTATVQAPRSRAGSPDLSGEERHRLTAPTGLAALGLDALASCAYGPEAIVLALAVAGAAGIGLTLPVTLVIVGLLAVVVLCYRQMIRAYPDGGGSYTVATENLGRRSGLVAAASLVVDYVLNVAVSVAVPLFAIGVFVGFALCQAGMVRHWWTRRGPGWRPRLALNALGAVLTAAAAVVVTAEKFLLGAWLIALVIPLLVVLFTATRQAYGRIGAVLEVDTCPRRPHSGASVVVVPVVGISRLAEEGLSTALSMG